MIVFDKQNPFTLKIIFINIHLLTDVATHNSNNMGSQFILNSETVTENACPDMPQKRL